MDRGRDCLSESARLLSRQMRLILTLLAILAIQAAPAAACPSAQNPRGVALLIGVADYRPPPDAAPNNSWPQLDNPVHDVEHVCAALAEAGFQTIVIQNPTFEIIDEALYQFRLAARESDTAIVYYAGHGFEFRGDAYIVPVDAPRISSQANLIGDFLPMDRLLSAASEARSFGLFLMDACRTQAPLIEMQDLPNSQGDIAAMGLFSVPRGAVIFSTISGRPALDEAPVGSPISPFANSIVRTMRIPNLELSAFYDSIHAGVVEQTRDIYPGGPQYPAFYKVAPNSFYLVVPPATQDQPQASSTPLTLPSLERLATEDEPSLMREILSRHTISELSTAAQGGEPAAQYLLGYAYNFGVGVRADRAEARQWMERSAAQNHPGGLTELAYLLQQDVLDTSNGLPTTEREELRQRALSLYEQAAAQDYAKAQSHLGHALFNGTLGVQDREYAISLLSEAARAGHAYAIAALASYVPAARDRSLQRLRNIANEGDAEGNNWLCELHYSAGDFYDPAALSEQAVADCEIAALNNYAGSRVIYATILANRLGTGQSAAEPAYWAELALSQPELATRADLIEIATRLVQ